MQIILKDLHKISLNEWYSGSHFSARVRIKNAYKCQVRSQFKHVFPKDRRYNVTYDFQFRVRPLDATNTVAMAKLIEDVIFEDDKWDIVESVTLSSRKGKEDRVVINVEEVIELIKE